MKNENMVKSFVIFLILIIIFTLSAVPIFAQIEWLRYDLNPVLDMGTTGSWDDSDIRLGHVIKDGDTLKMWYSAYHVQFVGGRIGYASSLDGINWTKHPNPVLDVGPPGSFDHGSAVCGSVIKDGDTLKMWYKGWAGGYHENRIGYATSLDGINWTKADSVNPVLDHGAPGTWNSVGVFFPSVIFDGITYHMWYSGADDNDDFRIGYATSPDGIDWYEHPDNPVLERSAGTWEDDVKVNIVIFDGTMFHMWYTGAHGYPYYRIGYATSPDGVNWTKADSVNPVMNLFSVAWEQDGVETGGVLFDGMTYNMWYSGYDGAHWRIGYARSSIVVDYVKVNKIYAAPGIDSVLITTKVKNPTGITLIAKIEAPDQTPVDSMELFDDGNHNDGQAGDSLYANLWPVLPVEERLYYVDLDVTRIDTNTVVNHMNNMAVFTTIGPVVFEDYTITSSDTIPHHGDKLKFQFTLMNDGLITTAINITSQVVCLDTLASLPTLATPEYGDIPAGSTAIGSAKQYIKFNSNAPDSVFAKFRLDIRSDDYLWWSDTFSVFVHRDPTGIDKKDENLPKEFALLQNYPNPFNPSTTIEFSIPKSEYVTLKIYNLLGQEVVTLVSEKLKAGSYNYSWEASSFASGIYLYKIEAGEFQQVKKLILMK